MLRVKTPQDLRAIQVVEENIEELLDLAAQYTGSVACRRNNETGGIDIVALHISGHFIRKGEWVVMNSNTGMMSQYDEQTFNDSFLITGEDPS